MKLKLKGLCAIGIGVVAMFVLGFAGSASAANLLYITGSYPAHFSGKGGATVLETTGGTKVESTEVHVLGNILTSTLFDVHLDFLKSTSSGVGCSNTSSAEDILANLVGHFGLAHPGDVPAVLLLIPGHVTFTCSLGPIEVKALVKGSVIGKITSPALNTESSLLALEFNQTKGVQEFRSFLLGNELLTGADQKTSTNGGSSFELSGQKGTADLTSSSSFLLISP